MSFEVISYKLQVAGTGASNIHKKNKRYQMTNDNLWYKDAIIYELHIKAFMDSNGDGIGDFNGLLQKLDYLEDLGVTAIWLLPFYPSPLRDDGYDISDYYSINPSYGDIDDFKRFMHEAHQRGLKVITELVVNHTSDQHPWFQRARIAPKGSPERDFYVWSDDPHKYSEVRIIFTDYETSNWAWDPVAEQYYWHRFFSHQPDLNFDNPLVQGEIIKVLDYWLNMGVDGFRLDAVPYLFEREGTNCENLPETHAFLKRLRKHVDENYEGKLLLAEANMWPEDSAAYFGKGDECHMNYHFPLMPRLFMSLKMEDRYPITDIFDQTPEIPDNCQWAMFLRNHDELTLEMVTDEERDYMYKVYTKEAKARINLGIRHRLAPLLDNNRKKIELMNILLFSLHGTPVLYYGDEIGMGDNYYLGDRDGVRTPMQWSADRNAGFSKANPHKLYLPAIIDPEYSYEAVNTETQQNNLSSLLWWTKRVINMRKRFKAFSRGDIRFLSPDNAKVIAFTRHHEGEIILVVANLSRFSQPCQVELDGYKGLVPEEVFSQNQFPKIGEGPYHFTLAPHGYFWFLLKKDVAELESKDYIPVQLPELNDFKELGSNTIKSALANEVLPKYLQRCRWFGGKARTIQRVNILSMPALAAGKQDFFFLICEVEYNEGLPELYQAPMAFMAAKTAKKEKLPDLAVIANLTSAGKKGKLIDAVYSPAFRDLLLAQMVEGKTYGNGLHLYADGQLKSEIQDMAREDLSSRVLNVEQSNSSIVYGEKYFLKLYRKLDRQINPDIEIIKYLTTETGFKSIPRFAGAIEYESGQQPMVLGMMQYMVENFGNAWDYVNEALEGFYERVLTNEGPVTFHSTEGKVVNPLRYINIPPVFQELIGGVHAERVNLLGHRTAEMHLALARPTEIPDFRPEGFSEHYQRSLFSSLQSLVRSAYQNLNKYKDRLPGPARKEAEGILKMKNDVLDKFREIYSIKIVAAKIRTHGDYHLGQALFTGKDFVIIDFEGEPSKSYSERRIKRSPLRDVAGMVRSFHYAAFNVLLTNDLLREEDPGTMKQFAAQWYEYMAGLFLHAYLSKVKGQNFIPADQKAFNILLETFILEKAIYELNYELNNRPSWALIPIEGIKEIMRKAGITE